MKDVFYSGLNKHEKRRNDVFKRFFCKHVYRESKTIQSKRVGNDNHVIEIALYKCESCGKSYTEEIIVSIEDDWYIK